MRTGENIYKRKDGRWEGRYQDGYKANGKPRYKSIYGKTYSEVKAKLKAIQSGNKPVSLRKGTFQELFTDYIQSIRFAVKESTLSTYQTLYECQIAPVFAGKRLSTITESTVNQFIVSKLSLVSSKYVSDIANLLFSVLKYGGIQLKSIRYRVSKPVIETLTDTEQERLEEYCLSSLDCLTLGILLDLNTGIRLGELCACRLEDIDLENKVLHITKTMQRIRDMTPDAVSKTKIVVTSPKSASSVRDIPLPGFLVKLIGSITKKLPKRAFLLTGEVHSFIEPRLMEYHFTRILEKCRIENRNFHILRHTFATNCVRDHVFDLKSLSEILGHSDIKITLQRYVHPDLKAKQEQMANIHYAFINRQALRQGTVKQVY